jgi:hypothetical protein
MFRKEIQFRTFSVMWWLRNHPHFVRYPDVTPVGLVDAISHVPFPVDFMPKSTSPYQADFIADLVGMTEEIYIPGIGDSVPRGLLTDLVRACGVKVWQEMQEEYWQSDIEVLASREDVSTHDWMAAYLVYMNHLLYIVGYCLPFAFPEASEDVPKWFEKIATSIEDVAEVLRIEYGIDIG